MNCTNCREPVQEDWTVCPKCQTPILEESSNPYSAPVAATVAKPSAKDPDKEGDGTGGIIPYKNPKALIAYYLGIFSGLPLLGLPIGIAAFALGVMGLRDRKKNPVIKGSMHAWIGIGCGGFFTLLWLLVIGSIIVSILAQA